MYINKVRYSFGESKNKTNAFEKAVMLFQRLASKLALISYPWYR